MSSNLLHLLIQPLDSLEDSGAANRRGAAAIGTPALGCGVSIAMDYQDTFYRDTKLTRDNLGKRRLFSLSVRGRASVDHHSATLLNTHACTLIDALWNSSLWTKAANFHIGGKANAHQLTFGTLAGLLSAQILVIDDLHSLFLGPRVVATVINRARRHLMRELIRFDKVDLTHFGWIFAKFTCHQVHGPLYEMRSLGTTSSTISIRRSFIRQNGVATRVDHWNVIAA